MSRICFSKTSKVNPHPSGTIQVSVVYHRDNATLGEEYKVKNDASTKQLLRMIGITIVPIIILVVMNAVFVHDATTASRVMEHVRDRIKSGLEDFSQLIHRLEIERGTTALYISSKEIAIYNDLQKYYGITDKAIDNITHWHVSDESETPGYFESKQTFSAHIQSFRDQLDPNVTTLYEDMNFYTNVIEHIKNIFLTDFQITTTQGIWPKLVSFELLVHAKGNAGIKRALGSTFYATGGFHNYSMYQWFLEKSFYGEALLETSFYYTPMAEDKYYSLLNIDSSLVDSLQKMEREIKLNDLAVLEPNWEKGDEWFRRMSKYIDFLLIIQNSLALVIMADLNIAIESLENEYILAVCILAGVVSLSPLIIHLIFKQTKRIQHIGDTLHVRTMQLEQERGRADTLLNQMLPPMVADELKSTGTVCAEFFDDVTICFSDLVNFTTMCTESTPMQVNTLLYVFNSCVIILMHTVGRTT